MTYTTDYVVRLTVGALVRVDEHGQFWCCQACLAKFASCKSVSCSARSSSPPSSMVLVRGVEEPAIGLSSQLYFPAPYEDMRLKKR